MQDLPTITHDSTHGHAAFIYKSPEEQWAVLGKFFTDGIADNELCVFVTPDDAQDALRNMMIQGYDLEAAYKSRAFRIFEMHPTYLPDGKFVADFMIRNVQSFQLEATELGYKGLRTAGEMEWLYDHQEYVDEATSYEAAVNEAPVAADNFVGLCLYPVSEHFMKLVGNVARTHPSLIYDGKITTNALYAS